MAGVRPPRARSEDKERVRQPVGRKLSLAFVGDRKNNEPEYEEVGPPIHLKRTSESRGNGHNCDLCGSMEAAVRCDKCGNQSFCLSCDDMYHRHPRRSAHVRKAVDTKISTGGGVRPPLPPKGEVPPPQPPPRKNKRAGFLSSSAFGKKDQAYGRPGTVASRSTSMTNLQTASSDGNSAGRTIMGSLKRFMGARPLPPTPDPGKGVASPNQSEASAAPAVGRPVTMRAATSPSLPNLNDHIEEELRKELPQSVADFNTTVTPHNSVSTPATPTSGHAQYPPLQPKTPQPQSATHTHSLGRKFSLQQLPQHSLEDKRTSMVESTPGGVAWEGEGVKPPSRTRSHSISDDQWAQVMATQPGTGGSSVTTEAPSGPTCPPGHTPADMSAFAGVAPRRSYAAIPGGRGGGPTLGRGMVSSASVCDLNSLGQQHPPQAFNGTHGANSFQQLNMMGYGGGGGMMWGAPCELCQAASAYPGHSGGMKRTASNLSMNLSSVGSDMTGYPWAAPPPHVHHHMPMYPGYYPGYHPHMVMPTMGAPMGLNVSIPDSMHTFGKVPSSPAPSVRSTSHRSHKSSKSRSFNAADASGRRSRNRKAKRSEESEESHSSSVSDDVDDVDDRESKSGHSVGNSLAWQCDHCTFINNGGSRTCGMCSKTVGSNGRTSRRGSERRRSERRRDRRIDNEDDDRDVSDYDNQDGGVVKSNLSFSIKDSKRENRSKMTSSNKSKSKKKSRRRGSSASDSGSESEGEEEERLERHMRDLRVSSRRRGSDYDGVNNKDKDKDRDRASRKKEGNVGRFKNRGRHHSERARTPGRQTPRHPSPAEDRGSYEDDSETSSSDADHQPRHTNLSADHDHTLNSVDGTLVDTLVSEATLKTDKRSKSNNSESKPKSKGSNASSPARSIVNEEQAQEPPHVSNEAKENKEKSPSPKRNVRKTSKSPALSRGEGDEPSFANTLDDVATMATNEIADQDLGSQYTDDQPQGADMVAEQRNPPAVQNNKPSTPAEECAEELQTILLRPPPATQGETKETQIKEEVKFVTEVETKKEDTHVAAPEPVYEPSYETVEEPAKVDIPEQDVKEEEPVASPEDIDQEHYQEAIPIEDPVVKKTEEAHTADDVQQVAKGLQNPPLDTRGEMARSASSGSSLGLNSPQDRQYTPLSFSSSDAQFYSPPDSPDLSLSEQLQENLQPGQTQASSGEGKGSPERPASADPSTTPHADVYEPLSFHDALTASDADALPRSASEQMPRPFKWGDEDMNEKFLTVEEIITKRRQEAMRKQGLKMVQILRDAEDIGYQPDDVSIALIHCGDKNPLEWLKENWRHMVDTVATLATNYGQERQVNDIGFITATEAKTALRIHKGNIWAAVTECVEQRQKKFSEIYARGRFRREDVVRALESNDGNLDAAFLEVNKSQLQPFLMKIWNPVQATIKKSQPTPPQPSPAPPRPPPPTSSAAPVQKEAVTLSVQTNITSEPQAPGTSQPSQAPKGILGGRMTPTFEIPTSKVPSRLWHGLCSLFDNSSKRSTSEYHEDDVNVEFVDTSDEDDIFENTYASIDHLKQPPKAEPIYATVKKRPKPTPKVEDLPKSLTLEQPKVPPREVKASSSGGMNQVVPKEEMFPAGEVTGPESEEDIDETDESEGNTSDEIGEMVRLSEAESQDGEQEEEVAAQEEQKEQVEEVEVEEEEVEDSEEEEVEVKVEVQDEPPPALQLVKKEESEDEESLEHEEPEQEEPQEPEEHDESEEAEEPDETAEPKETVEAEEDKHEVPERAALQQPPIEPGMLQTRTGPVTIQKASVIVGKAIAKAMARESSVRDSHSRSETPEQQEAPMATPESSEEEEEATQVSVSDSDSDDQLHILDTIPEEEEISEMTESGKVIIRPGSKRTPSRGEASASPAAPSPPAPPSPTPSPAAVPPAVAPGDVAAIPPPPKTPSPVPPEPEPPQELPKADDAKEVVAATNKKSQAPSATPEKVSTPSKDDAGDQKAEVKENTTVRRRRRVTAEEASEGASTAATAAAASTAAAAASTATATAAASTSTSTPSSSNTNTSSLKKRRRRKSLPESSGESEGEDGVVKADRIEGLKARPNKKEPDYQEMRELKEQIQMMRRELETRIEDTDDRPESPETPQDDQPTRSPYILIPDAQQEKPPPMEYEQLKFDRTVRRLLAEGQSGTYEKAELAAHLLNLNFDESDSVQAAEECSSIYTAIQFLQQECELCAEKYPMKKMVSMLQCIHRCCCDCAKTYFTFQIKTKNIREVRCPFCNEPDLDANEEIANEYLNNMDILLKNILDPETHELFQRKLRDWTLMKDPNFRWCNKCSSGFIANARARKLICPDCKDVTCAQCRAPWEPAHEGISCEKFARWKADNDMEVSLQGVAKHLAECGITCPNCKFTYSLAKGGCMHFTCTQCKYEFCSGCGQPFRQGARCPVGPYCERLGLHAHHPRNCLFYLRDKEPQQLQNLLKDAGVSYDTEPPEALEQKGGRTSCKVQEQKELADGLKDDICGRTVPSGYAGLCRKHYLEYLGHLCYKNCIDPLPIMDEEDLRYVLRRENLTMPKRRLREPDLFFKRRMIKLIKEHLPLESLN